MKKFFYRLLKYVCVVTIAYRGVFAMALEVDEKLTLRILNVSNSKKTMLINRGLEDGLAVGDHAKFYLTTGIVSRGVIVKTSPSRSIWSLYRVVDNEQLALDKVMNLKISAPVKLSQDKTKMLSQDSSAEPAGIPLAPGAEDAVVDKNLSPEDKEDLAKLSPESTPATSVDELPGLAREKSLEVWGIMHFTGLSASQDAGSSGTSSGSDSVLDFSVGIEKYFTDRKLWLHNITLQFLLHYSSRKTIGLGGTEMSLTAYEYGGGGSWHFWADPFAYGKPIGFITANFGLGSTQEFFAQNTNSVVTEGETLSGKSSFFSIGAGLKYYLARGWGFRMLLDYYRRAEQYSIAEEDSDYSKVVSGPRMMVGLSYRW